MDKKLENLQQIAAHEAIGLREARRHMPAEELIQKAYDALDRVACTDDTTYPILKHLLEDAKRIKDAADENGQYDHEEMVELINRMANYHGDYGLNHIPEQGSLWIDDEGREWIAEKVTDGLPTIHGRCLDGSNERTHLRPLGWYSVFKPKEDNNE